MTAHVKRLSDMTQGIGDGGWRGRGRTFDSDDWDGGKKREAIGGMFELNSMGAANRDGRAVGWKVAVRACRAFPTFHIPTRPSSNATSHNIDDSNTNPAARSLMLLLFASRPLLLLPLPSLSLSLSLSLTFPRSLAQLPLHMCAPGWTRSDLIAGFLSIDTITNSCTTHIHRTPDFLGEEPVIREHRGRRSGPLLHDLEAVWFGS